MPRFVQVDAFTDRAFAGNPAAVIPLDAWPDDALLLAIAAENNLSETAFAVPLHADDDADDDGDPDADYDLRWFTPTVEVALCGHATLAAAHVLLPPAPATLRFRTRRAGILTVTHGDMPGTYTMDLPAWAPEPAPLPDIVAALGGTAVETAWHPGGYALVAYASAAEVRALTPDFPALARLGNILHIATAPGTGTDTGTDIVSRAFAPAAGVDEDPVTGSAHAVLAPWWAPRLGRDHFTAWQASARGGRLACRHDPARTRVVITGACVTVIEGMIRF